ATPTDNTFVRTRKPPSLWISALLLASASPAWAYDAVFAHPWMTRSAATLLYQSDPETFAELYAHIERLAEGAEHEDDIFLDGDTNPETLRVMRHFYRPTDQTGLVMENQTFPSSFVWSTTPRQDNAWDWHDA